MKAKTDKRSLSRHFPMYAYCPAVSIQRALLVFGAMTLVFSGLREQSAPKGRGNARPAANSIHVWRDTGFNNSVAFSPDGGTLVLAGGDGRIRLLTVKDAAAAPRVIGQHQGVHGEFQIAFKN